ncbi:hypothetical protein RJ640_021812 [Escallonia rubra]|uniref:Uncharacterized protein n=1 Tax=Escallonia rubra TaxID=112253 RepID=A0AA88SL51_9ASTE|nr:hypothetical protein RJ640_021812 [Escallonia rubra]
MDSDVLQFYKFDLSIDLESKAQVSPQRTPNGEEKKENRGTFAIALTREEIEEDVFAMTGARPSRTGLQSSVVIVVEFYGIT